MITVPSFLFLELWINSDEIFVVEYTDTSLNTGVRSAYFTTFAIPDVNFAIKFYGGAEANPTNFTSGYDGEFSGFKNVTVAAGGKPNQLLEYSIAGVPLKTYVTLAEAEGFSIVSDIDVRNFYSWSALANNNIPSSFSGYYQRVWSCLVANIVR